MGKGVTPLCCGKLLGLGVVGRVVGWWSGVVVDRLDGLVSSTSENSRIEVWVCLRANSSVVS